MFLDEETTLYKKSFKSFLNKDGFHDIAAIHFEINVANNTNYNEGNLKISDCNKNITLDFEINNQENQENSIHKMDTLIESLIRAKASLQEAIKIHNDNQQKLKEDESRKSDV